MRINKEMARLFYGLLALFKREGEESMARTSDTIYRVVRDLQRSDPQPWMTPQHITSIGRCLTHPSAQPEEAFNNLAEYISGSNDDSSNKDGELVSLIIEVLQMPLASNRLAGTTLRTLRRAILTPEELRTVETSLIHCGRCGRVIQSGEACSLQAEEGRSQYLACAACMMPQYVACSHRECNVKTPLSAKFLKEAKKAFVRFCPEHAPGVNKAPEEAVMAVNPSIAELPRNWGERIVIDSETLSQRLRTSRPNIRPARPARLAQWEEDPIREEDLDEN